MAGMRPGSLRYEAAARGVSVARVRAERAEAAGLSRSQGVGHPRRGEPLLSQLSGALRQRPAQPSPAIGGPGGAATPARLWRSPVGTPPYPEAHVTATINDRGEWQFTHPDGRKSHRFKYEEMQRWWEILTDEGYEIEVTYEG